MGRSSTMVPFFTDNIKIKNIESASDLAAFNMEGKTIHAFTKGRPTSLEKFDDGAFVVRCGERFIEYRPN